MYMDSLHEKHAQFSVAHADQRFNGPSWGDGATLLLLMMMMMVLRLQSMLAHLAEWHRGALPAGCSPFL